MTVFGWEARPGPVRVLAAALGLEPPAPGSLVFDALARGVARYRVWRCPGDPPHSVKKKMEVAIGEGQRRYWAHHRPRIPGARGPVPAPLPNDWLDLDALPLLAGAAALDALFDQEDRAAVEEFAASAVAHGAAPAEAPDAQA